MTTSLFWVILMMYLLSRLCNEFQQNITISFNLKSKLVKQNIIYIVIIDFFLMILFIFYFILICTYNCNNFEIILCETFSILELFSCFLKRKHRCERMMAVFYSMMFCDSKNKNKPIYSCQFILDQHFIKKGASDTQMECATFGIQARKFCIPLNQKWSSDFSNLFEVFGRDMSKLRNNLAQT